MARVYRCDICGAIADNPFQIEMTTYRLDKVYACDTIFHSPTRQETSMDVCMKCNKAMLKYIRKYGDIKDG